MQGVKRAALGGLALWAALAATVAGASGPQAAAPEPGRPSPSGDSAEDVATGRAGGQPDDMAGDSAEVHAREARDAIEALKRLRLPWQAAATDGPATSNAAAEDMAAADPKTSVPSTCPPARMRSRFLALPVYGTLPNEGSTFGAIPILLRVCSGDGHTHNIYAPSVSYNAVLGVTGTLRWFGFLPGQQSVTATASWSQRTNRGVFLLWEVRPPEVGKVTLEALAQGQQSIFFRLYGIGPGSLLSQESNQARRRALVSVRAGLNLPHRLDLGLILQARADQSLEAHIPSLVPSRDRFAGLMGVEGASAGLAALVDLRFDSRRERDYAARGIMANLQLGTLFGLTGVPTHLRAQAEVRALWSHTAWFCGAARARINYMDHPQVPFYYLSPLGGGMLLRGFIEDRFMDRGAWLLEVEQRFRILRTDLLGVTVDWRIDPFLAVGQVFHDANGIFSRPRLAGGIGLRAWLQPNVVGRIDVAYGGEGIAPYVELGYPF